MDIRLTTTAIALALVAGQAMAQTPAAKPPKWDVSAPPGMTTRERW